MQKEIKVKLSATLKQVFKLEEFRPGQLEALTAILHHGRVLCIHPTGSGKSLLYQIPAVILPGITLVISPLLALMRDQLAQLNQRFEIAAATINSDQTEQENNQARLAVRTGKIKILFIAPEQLEQMEKSNFLLSLPVNLLVVDEAHCISTWGHDFRPSYRRIIKLADALIKKTPTLKLLALTATANPKTEEDIKFQLAVDKQELIVQRTSMDRPNLRLSIFYPSGLTEKLTTLLQLMDKLKGCGIIYCATRENTVMAAEYLKDQGKKAVAYHAGLETNLKRRIQQGFVADEYPIVVATNALGMGIDKANLRFVIHFDFPGSLTAYYQEVGRAGRDGQAAEGILLYDPANEKIQKFFIDAAFPELSEIERVLKLVKETHCSLLYLQQTTGMHRNKLNVIINELLQQGFLQTMGKQVYRWTDKPGKADFSRFSIQHSVKLQELTLMQDYAEKSHCLMKTLRMALGDKKANKCQLCNNCVSSAFRFEHNPYYIKKTSLWLKANGYLKN